MIIWGAVWGALIGVLVSRHSGAWEWIVGALLGAYMDSSFFASN